jgi:hypothetical protein
MPGLNISFRNDLCKVLFVPVVINQSSVVQKFRANQRFNRILSPERILLVLLTTL